MKKIAEFFSKWGFVVILNLVGIALLFALGCCIYTAIVNAFAGCIGIVGVLCVLAVLVGLIFQDIKDGV